MTTALYTREQIHLIIDQLLLFGIIPNTSPGSAVSEQGVIKPPVSWQPADQPLADAQKKEEPAPSVVKLTLTVDEAAKLIGVSKPKLFEILHSNLVPYKKMEKRLSFPEKSSWNGCRQADCLTKSRL